MKLNPVILIIVVALGIYIGLHSNDKKPNATVNAISQQQKNTANEKGKISKEEQQKRFTDFYNKVYIQLHNFEKIDTAIKKLSNNNPTKLQAYEAFTKLKDTMEEGQKLPLGTLIPEGFSKTHEKTFNDIIDELYSTFEYRKFGYEHFLAYLETGSLKEEEESKQWLSSANGSLNSAMINLVGLKAEIGIIGDSTVEKKK